MKTHVMGKKIKRTYKVCVGKDDEGKYVLKPFITTDDIEIKWEEILVYETAPQSRSGYCSGKYINLSEDEEVEVEKEVFRADLGEWYQYTSKELEEKDNRKKIEKELEKEIAAYNKYMIENNKKAKAYCDLHKLDYSETDYGELLDLIKELEPEKPKSMMDEGYFTVTDCSPHFTTMPFTQSSWLAKLNGLQV